MKIDAWGIVLVLAMAAWTSLLADDADSNHLFKSKGSLDAFFDGTPETPPSAAAASPNPATISIRGRVLRIASDGLLVKRSKRASDSDPGMPAEGGSQVHRLVWLRNYPSMDGLVVGACIQVVAYSDGSYSYTNASGIERTVDAYSIDLSSFSVIPARESPAPQEMVGVVDPNQGTKPRGWIDANAGARPHDHAPKPGETETRRPDSPSGSHPPESTPGATHAPEHGSAGGEGDSRQAGPPPGGDAPGGRVSPGVPPKP